MYFRTKRPLYKLWRGMIGRCTNPNHPSWEWYGAKGVSICERWKTFENFESDMVEKPPGMSLDRVDGSGPYSPENCRWATHKEQGRNKSNIRKVTIDGKEHLLVELAEISGHKADTVAERVAQNLPYCEVINPKRRYLTEKFRGILAHNRAMAEATHCQRGHEFTPENTDHYGNQRRCRQCRLVVQARYKAKKKAERQLSAARIVPPALRARRLP